MDIIEKAERLQELAKLLEGTSAPTANLITAALELVAELAEKVNGLEEELKLLTEEVDDMDDALAELAEDVYGDDLDETFEVECPYCGEQIQIDEGILNDGGITCPACDSALEFEFGCDCEDDDCDCGECGHKE